MAGDWIKMRSDLFTHPKVVRMASALKADGRPDVIRVVGGLMSVWCLFDAHSVDGVLEGYTPDLIDDQLRWEGFASAMVAVGWLAPNADGSPMSLPDFGTHNGQSAKRRAQDADRKRDDRKTSASDADKKRTREEKRREEKGANAPLPNCPSQKLLALFIEKAPALPCPKLELWDGAKADALRQRWKWVLTAKRGSGARYAETEEQAIEWFGRFFDHVQASEFLSGRDGAWTGCSLDWLVIKDNFAKVVQGNYKNKGNA